MTFQGAYRRVVSLSVTSYDWEGPVLRDRLDPPVDYVVVETQQAVLDPDTRCWCVTSDHVLPPVPYVPPFYLKFLTQDIRATLCQVVRSYDDGVEVCFGQRYGDFSSF